jgi:hypothetical protein
VTDGPLPPRRGASRNVDDEAGAPQRGDDLLTSLRSSGNAGAVAGIAPPTPILYVPGKTAIGGGQFALLGPGPDVTIAQYVSPDDKPRKVTCRAWSPFPNGNGGVGGGTINGWGLAVKITEGGVRGSTTAWHGIPCQVPAEGTRITMEARIVNSPFNFGFKGTLVIGNSEGKTGPLFTPFITPGVFVRGTAQGLILDGDLEEPIGELITNNQLANFVAQGFSAGQPDGVSGAQAPGPVLVSDVTLTNTSASPVTIGFFDIQPSPGGLAFLAWPQALIGVVTVPAGSTSGVSRVLLGSYYQGFVCTGITAASALSGPNYIADANGANVLVTVRGTYFRSGHA